MTNVLNKYCIYLHEDIGTVKLKEKFHGFFLVCLFFFIPSLKDIRISGKRLRKYM